MLKAVITGDIVHSTRMTSDNKDFLYKSLGNLLKQLEVDFKIKSEIFRGDSFQCLTDKPSDALRIALLIKTFIRSLNPSVRGSIVKDDLAQKKPMLFTKFYFDSRIAIGIGEVHYKATTLANSDGPAFHLSGHLLDAMKNKKQFLAMASSDRYNDELATEAVLLDAILSKTTALQCDVIYYKLIGYTETEIANYFNIMQSAVNQRSNSASWNAIHTMVERFENIYNG